MCAFSADGDQAPLPDSSGALISETLFRGKFLSFNKRGHWEFVERCNVTGTVAILAITDSREIILVEQFRPPVNRRVIEVPAGLAGDIPSEDQESLAEAAGRELLEETGYQAASLECLTEGPSSAGISTEVISFFRARGLKKISKGGGDQSEDITVHVIPLDGLMTWLDSKRREGCLVDYKIFAGLFFEFSRDGIG